MQEEIRELCDKLKNLDSCKTCGGTHQGGICMFCGKENQEIIYLSLQLEKKINNLTANLFGKESLNSILTSLYSIRTLDIPLVNKILLDFNYENTILKTHSYIQNNIKEIINNNITLSKEQYDFLVTSFLNKEYTGNSENMIANIIIKAILDKNKNLSISKEIKEKIFLRVSCAIANNVLGFSASHAYIQEDVLPESEKRNKSFGGAFYNDIFLSRKTIHDEPDNIFVTIFHELVHLRQYMEHDINQILSGKNLIEIKDSILSDILPLYYDENYLDISYEKEAFYYQHKETIDYFNCINVEISNKMREKAVMYDQAFGDFLSNMYRKDKGTVVILSELFDKEIINHSEYLSKYPQLNFEYKLKDNMVLPKTIEELKNDFNNFQNGSLNFNGDREEIFKMYNDKISELENEQKNGIIL